ncbi:MAG TPA: hypothetical protein VN618_14500 [Solirubrobacteraceae bacterium]|nr:hypothetical protein [Solirubrobacteraceae bacterium]
MRKVRGLLVAAAVSACVLAGGTSSAASAALAPEEALTYIPFGFVHNQPTSTLVAETLEPLQHYGVGQNLLPLPKLKPDGRLKLNKRELANLHLWVSGTTAYNAEHGTSILAVGSFSGKVKGKSLNLEDPAVRANVVAAAETVVSLGLGGLSLDFEPYPTSRGYLTLLAEIDAMFARRGFAGRLAVAAPASVGRWSPQYMEEITALLGQVDPLFYDSERKTPASYEQWVREGLAYYSAHTAPGTRIIPDLPSYGPNRWHDPTAENLGTATTAIEGALAEGSRVNGAGIYWWWGFYFDEEGEGSYVGAPDRETWLTRTLSVAFTP